MRQIPLVDLQAQTKSIYKEIMLAIDRVVLSGRYLGGEEIERFEDAFATYCGTKYCIAVSSGTDALELALKSCNIGNDSVVMTSALTFVATISAILRTGADVALLDVDPHTLSMDIASAGTYIYRKYAVIPVHLYGFPADMGDVKSIADKYSAKMIEDAAQAHGATYGGKKVGSFSDAAAFSFYPAKNLGAFGDAGAIVTDDADIADFIRAVRNHGRTDWDTHRWIGGTHRMDEIQAAVLNVKLKCLDDWNEMRCRRVSLYCNALDTDLPFEVVTPLTSGKARSVYHLFVIRAERRDELRQYLADNGIATGIHYAKPVHLQPCFASLGYKEGDFPVAEKACKEILSLPLYPEMPLEDVAYVAEKVNDFFRNGR